MSADTDGGDTARTREEKLKSLVRRDLNDEITALATEALRHCQEESS